MGRRNRRRLYLAVDLFPPDRRQRDLDNAVKALLDGLTAVEIWLDDSLIDLLVLRRGLPVAGGLRCEYEKSQVRIKNERETRTRLGCH